MYNQFLFLPLSPLSGGLAQLVERLHGMQEVIGSNPLSSTNSNSKVSPSVYPFAFYEVPNRGYNRGVATNHILFFQKFGFLD